ncbi:flagellar assembly protein A [Campylobacter sp.]|uniref:flagellar assembly protein A n=1 Tax=Campylobacter sp. TaxID=205 RepID=UPI0025C2E552|nr:flagellar assembly protein A [Campylobacter sp.]
MEENKILYTKDPHKDLLSYANINKIDVEELDYKLLSFNTSYTFNNQEWIKANEKDLQIFEEDEKFLDPNLNIQQEYKIQIDKKEKIPSSKFKVELKTNESITFLYANVKASEKIVYYEKIALEVFEAIYKQMIKEGFLLGFRIFDFKKQIVKFNTKLKENKIFDYEVNFEVSKGLNPQNPTNEDIKFHYIDKLKQREDMMNRNYIAPIGKDEVAIEKIKPQEGKEGRNLKLKILKSLPPKVINKEQINVSNNFSIKEDEKSIQYIANKNGFITNENSTYEIKNYLELDKVDFKSTGSIWAGMDKQVSIVIKNTNSLEEAVGSRITIEAQELEVVGNIAQDAVLRAQKILLKGNMHQKSKIYGQDVDVNILKGYCEAVDFKAQSLENGIVKAKKVNIKKVIGGEIIADEIYIEELFDNCICSAKKLIHIDKIQGSGNKISIEHTQIFDQDNEDVLQNLELGKIEQEKIKNEMEEIRHTIYISRDSVKLLQQKSKEFLNTNKSIPLAYKNTIRDYNQKVELFNNLKVKLEHLQEKEEQDIEKIKGIQEELLEAKIINKSGDWLDLNEIKFKMLYPNKEFVYVPRKDEKIQCLKIEKTGENNSTYEIRIFANYKE